MKILQHTVFLLVMLFSMLVCANSNPILNAQAPVQRYESANTPPPKLESRLTKATKESSTSQSHLNSIIVNPLKTQQKELNQVISQKIHYLTAQNKTMQVKLQQLTAALLVLNQQISAINNRQAESVHYFSLRNLFKYLTFGVTVLLAIMLGTLISYQKKKQKA